MTCKWEDSVYLTNDQISDYYKKANDRCLYFVGKGFDPRMCEGLKLLSLQEINITVCLIEYTEGRNSTSCNYIEQINSNYEELKKMGYKIVELNIDVALMKLPVFFKNKLQEKFFKDIDRIIIDISSMPQTISFNLIKFIYLTYHMNRKIDIITCENSRFDDSIKATGLNETANYLSGFNRFSIDKESDENTTTVWIPILGKTCKEELEKIFSFVSPKEICPVLPFPSQDPNKSDQILSLMGELLFVSFLVEKTNILYVSENNAIQAYKKLCNTVAYYNEALGVIDEDTKFIFSSTSSKLLGLGALLASMEISSQKIDTSFALVENEGYFYDPSEYNPAENNIYCLCLNESMYECEYI